MDFNAFTEEIIRNAWNVFGTEVYEQGVLTHAWGDTQENLHGIFSATKSILSIAAGIAWDRGLIDFDKSVTAYMPEDRIRKLSAKQREIYGKITLHRLMTMSVPDLPFRAEGDSWLDFSLAYPVAEPEKRVFNYSNINAYLTGVALTEAVGEDLELFIRENILHPLGITRYECTRCPEGYFYGASGMKLTVHDLAQIGLMLYNRGVRDGKRIVSEEYIRKATAIQQMCREGGYGYFFWKYLDGFSINGRMKQKCYVLPDRGLVIAYLAYIEDPSPALKNSMEKHLLGMR